MIEKFIGKIQHVSFGLGGYDEMMLGLTVTLGSDKENWGTSTFRGTWANPPSEQAKWTVESQTEQWGELVRWIGTLLDDAKVKDITQLVGKPIEATFKDYRIDTWRVLTEAI